MSIVLIDNKISDKYGNAMGGHAFRYCRELLGINGTKWTSDYLELNDLKEGPIKYMVDRSRYLSKYINEDIVHILQLDEFYKAPLAFRMLKRNGCRIIATLHHYPTSRSRAFFLKLCSKYIDVIVVHSTYIKNIILEMGVKCLVKVIEYPVFDEVAINYIAQNNNKLSDNKVVKFLCLGDTRKDKGLNILIESFKYLQADTKERAVFVVAGKERDIFYSTLEKEANKYGITIIMEPGYIEDNRYWELIDDANIILLPYTKIFTGASGPLTDGVFFKKKILGCDYGNIGDTIIQNDLGVTFNTENPEDLAMKIKECVTNEWKSSLRYDSYRNRLDKRVFVESYKKVYKSLQQ